MTEVIQILERRAGRRRPDDGLQPATVSEVAHGLNNVLMSILNNGELLGLSLPPEMVEEREEAEEVVIAARRGAELVRALRRVIDEQERGA